MIKNNKDYYAAMLQKAKTYNINCADFDDDIVGLEQEIEYQERKLHESDQELRHSYYCNLGVV